MKYYHFICCFCFVLIVSCKRNTPHLAKITAENIRINTSIKSSSVIDSMIAPYRGKMITEMEEVLSYSPKNLLKNDGAMQSSLGNLMADLSFDIANPIYKKQENSNIDFAMFNSGGIRSIISKGNITREVAFKIMPFDNEFVVVTLTGDKVAALVAYFIKGKKAHPLSKNVALTIDSDAYALKINGKEFDKSKTYKVLTSDYLQSGGDRMLFFKDPIKLTKLNYRIRDGIINYFQKTDTLQSTIDKRILIK